MASTYALGAAAAAILASLQADAGLIAALPKPGGGVRIWDEVPNEALRSPDAYVPYLVVESGSEDPFNTMGPPDLPKWGAIALVQVRAVSQFRGDAEVSTLMNLVKARLDGQPLSVPGFATVSVAFQRATLLKATVNGVLTRELVSEFEVTVHQS